MYKIYKKWFTKGKPNGSIDKVVVGGKSLRIGYKKEVWRGKEYIQGEMPTNQRILGLLYDMEKPYVIKVEEVKEPVKVKSVKPKKSKVKDEPKDINEESKEVSTEEKED